MKSSIQNTDAFRGVSGFAGMPARERELTSRRAYRPTETSRAIQTQTDPRRWVSAGSMAGVYNPENPGETRRVIGRRRPDAQGDEFVGTRRERPAVRPQLDRLDR